MLSNTDPEGESPPPDETIEELLPEVDENLNVVSLQQEEKDKPEDILKLLTRNNNEGGRQRFNVYNLMANFAGMFGYKNAFRKKVRFPVEIIQHAIVKGEVSPDDTAVPRFNYPFKGWQIYSQKYSAKKSQVVKVTRGAEFRPKLAWIEDTTDCDVRCEKFVTSCKCVPVEYQDPRTVLRAKKSNKKKKEKNLVSKLTELFMCNVNIADTFLLEHKLRTLLSALQYVDGILVEQPPAEPLLLQEESIIIPEPAMGDGDTETGVYVDELPPPSQSRIGRLAANIWIFGNCVPFLFSPTDNPSEPSYRMLMGDFAALAMSAYDGARNLIHQSKDFENYAAEAMRVVRNLQNKIYLQGDTNVKEAISVGGGIQLQRKANPTTRPGFVILVAKNEKDESLHFKPFNTCPSTSKILALRNLMTATLYEFDHSKHQIDFLVDDIKETTYDSKCDTDLLYRISEMYHCICSISSNIQNDPTSPKNEVELKVICETMSKFVLSLNSFFNASDHIMEKIMEVRDMVQLTYTWLQKEMKIDLSKLMPADKPNRFVARDSLPSFLTSNFLFCCGGKKKGQGGSLKGPNYKSSDFCKVCYEDIFDSSQDIVTAGYVFRVIPTKKVAEEPTCPKIRFRLREPTYHLNKRDSASSIESVDSIPALGSPVGSCVLIGETLEENASAQVTLKPILKRRKEGEQIINTPVDNFEARPESRREKRKKLEKKARTK